jgi:outer membrane protein TolC
MHLRARPHRSYVKPLAPFAALLLAGCASFSPDGGMGAVQAIAGRDLNKDVIALRTPEEAALARAETSRLLQKPLTAASAVQIALLNNRDLQAAYNALGLAEAVRIRASLPDNPRFSLSRIAGGGGLEIEGQIVANILALATLPARAEIADDRFRQAQLQAVLETVRVAAETRRAFYRAVAARELSGFLVQAQDSADAAVQLSRRLGESGAMNKLDQARNQVFYAELTAQLGTARQRVLGERESLIRWMGLWGSDLAFKLPSALPAIPGRPRNPASIEVEAVRRRPDLQMARIELAALGKSYGLTHATRFLNLVEASGIAKHTHDPEGRRFNEYGAGIEVEVPIFDFGEVRLKEAEQAYMEGVNRLAAKAVTIRSEAREAYQLYRSSYDIARHYQRDVLPPRKIISEEILLRYNAMQIDVFSLLVETRERITSTLAAIDAKRNYWLADVALQAAVIGGGANLADPTTASMPAAGQAAGAH